MLPKAKRLTSAEVREVLKKGTPVRAGAVSARYTVAERAKAAVVVSTKVAKKATERNRLRRLGYRALSRIPARLHLVVFIHRTTVTESDITTLCSKLSS